MFNIVSKKHFFILLIFNFFIFQVLKTLKIFFKIIIRHDLRIHLIMILKNIYNFFFIKDHKLPFQLTFY